MVIINSNMVANKNLCKIYYSVTFISSEFIGTVFMTCVYVVFAGTALVIFVGTVLVRFIDTLFMTFIILLHTIT